MIKSKIIAIFLSLLSLTYGILIGKYMYFPYNLIKMVAGSFRDRNLQKETISPDYTRLNILDYQLLNPSEIISINNTNIDSVRSIATKIIFGKNNLPQQFPDSVYDITDKRYCDLKSVSKIRKFKIILKNNLQSIGYIFFPKVSNEQLIIYHQGHDGDFLYNKHTISHFLEKGFTVYCFCMPLLGLNNTPIVSHKKLGTFKLLTHEDLQYLENPLSYFVEPVCVMLNYSEKYHYKRVIMTGISGGGWTTTICAGIDQRINVSFPVAGSLPMYIKLYNNEKDMGDFEQHYSPLFSQIDYLDFYILGSAGKGRLQLQITNKYDPCCWDGVKAKHYEKAVENIAHQYLGKFSVFIDSTHMEHKISEKALEIMSGVLN